MAFEDSLTRELTRLGKGDFRLRLVGEAIVETSSDPRWLTGTDIDLPGVHREVVLIVGGEPVVAARSLIPIATAERQGWLGDLGASSLGHALFVRDDVQRSPLQYARFAANSPWLSGVGRRVPAVARSLDAHGVASCWARRSCFRVGGDPLLVMELFLPAARQLALAACGKALS